MNTLDYAINAVALIFLISILLPILWQQIATKPLLYILIASIFCILTTLKQILNYFTF